MNKYRVKIVETLTGESAWTSHLVGEREAEKIERGVNINLNHDDFHTEITEEEEQ